MKGKSDMKINCLSRGRKVDLDQVSDNSESEVKCFACDVALHIMAEQGRLKSGGMSLSLDPEALDGSNGGELSEVAELKTRLAQLESRVG